MPIEVRELIIKSTVVPEAELAVEVLRRVAAGPGEREIMILRRMRS